MAMFKHFNRLIVFRLTSKNLALLLLLAPLYCGAIPVSWEEEVLLNTGEVIWVNKEVSYSIRGQPGNPLDLGYLSDRVETISFKYGENIQS